MNPYLITYLQLIVMYKLHLFIIYYFLLFVYLVTPLSLGNL